MQWYLTVACSGPNSRHNCAGVGPRTLTEVAPKEVTGRVASDCSHASISESITARAFVQIGLVTVRRTANERSDDG